jgi:hypothetical protein
MRANDELVTSACHRTFALFDWRSLLQGALHVSVLLNFLDLLLQVVFGRWC